MKIEEKKRIIASFIIGFILLNLDFIVKHLANKNLSFQELTTTPIPILNLYLTHNTGYHYIFGEISNHKLWAGFGIVMVIILIISLTRSIIHEKTEFHKNIYAIILMLTIGAAGNVIEILTVGRATDFFMLVPFPWPSNLCDQYINIIIYVMLPIILINTFIEWIKTRKNEKNSDENIK